MNNIRNLMLSNSRDRKMLEYRMCIYSEDINHQLIKIAICRQKAPTAINEAFISNSVNHIAIRLHKLIKESRDVQYSTKKLNDTLFSSFGETKYDAKENLELLQSCVSFDISYELVDSLFKMYQRFRKLCTTKIFNQQKLLLTEEIETLIRTIF